jgi:hypothetical protein
MAKTDNTIMGMSKGSTDVAGGMAVGDWVGVAVAFAVSVGVGEGVGVAVTFVGAGVAVALGVGLGEGEGEGLGEGEAVGVDVGVGLGVGVGESVGVGLGLGVGVAVGVGLGVGEAVGVGLGVCALADKNKHTLSNKTSVKIDKRIGACFMMHNYSVDIYVFSKNSRRQNPHPSALAAKKSPLMHQSYKPEKSIC